MPQQIAWLKLALICVGARAITCTRVSDAAHAVLCTCVSRCTLMVGRDALGRRAADAWAQRFLKRAGFIL